MSVTVEIDDHSGFCFGVTTAIRKAEEELNKGGTLYCLGDIVHNGEEVKRLERLGLVTINHEQFAQLRNSVVLFRAHGEPPSTYRVAQKNGITLIDATCPVVLRLQQKIKRTYDAKGEDMQIVIFGKRGHAEVNGLVGQTNDEAIVVESQEDLPLIDRDKHVTLFSQTTKSLEEYNHLSKRIGTYLKAGKQCLFNDTICRQVANRIPNIRHFASSHDLILFVSGKKSSNGKILFTECQRVNPKSYFISGPDELNPSWLDSSVRTIGICGATSTPKWLMEQVRRQLETRVE